jgi:hypothetical protein
MSSVDGKAGFRGGLPSLWVMLGLFALVVRTAIPAGWMPSQRVGTVSLILCSGSGTKAVVVDLGGSTGDHPSKDGHPCSFAVGGSPALQPVVHPLAIALVAAYFLDNWLPGPTRPEADAAWQTPPSLGP